MFRKSHGAAFCGRARVNAADFRWVQGKELVTHYESWLLEAALVQGYAFARVGHFFFERSRPATLKYSGYSLMGDWRLWWEILTAKRPF